MSQREGVGHRGGGEHRDRHGFLGGVVDGLRGDLGQMEEGQIEVDVGGGRQKNLVLGNDGGIPTVKRLRDEKRRVPVGEDGYVVGTGCVGFGRGAVSSVVPVNARPFNGLIRWPSNVAAQGEGGCRDVGCSACRGGRGGR